MTLINWLQVFKKKANQGKALEYFNLNNRNWVLKMANSKSLIG